MVVLVAVLVAMKGSDDNLCFGYDGDGEGDGDDGHNHVLDHDGCDEDHDLIS